MWECIVYCKLRNLSYTHTDTNRRWQTCFLLFPPPRFLFSFFPSRIWYYSGMSARLGCNSVLHAVRKLIGVATTREVRVQIIVGVKAAKVFKMEGEGIVANRRRTRKTAIRVRVKVNEANIYLYGCIYLWDRKYQWASGRYTDLYTHTCVFVCVTNWWQYSFFSKKTPPRLII